MKCCVEGCERHPAKGDHFFRVNLPPEPGVWVCAEHKAGVKMDPEIEKRHARYASFFANGGLVQ